MSAPPDSAGPRRRDFLRSAATLAGLAVIPAPVRAAESGAAPPTPVPAPEPAPAGYLSLSPDEAAFVEQMVTVMCPADELTPGGVECGLATFIDRQLAGGFGRGERLFRAGPWRPGAPEDGYQLPLTPEAYFKLGLAATDEVCRRRHGREFATLTAADADALLHALAAGEVSHPTLRLDAWFNELVYPLFEQACFADPMYGGNRDKVFWKLIGYPGLPAVNGLNMVKYRGQPFPGAATPKSIQDFS